MMQKKILSLLVALSAIAGVRAESFSLWSFGLRGGGNIYMMTDGADGQLGYGGDLDFGYTCYWSTPHAEVGIHTGLSAGMCTSRFSGSIHRQFTNYDYLDYRMDYTIAAQSVNQDVQQVQAEVPLMLAIRANGVFINMGAKWMMPLYDRYKQSMKDITIDAYYERPDVHVTNRLITGLAGESQLDYTGKGCLPKYNILLGFETGYEWNINDRDKIGLGIYGDISPWSSYQQSNAHYVIDVTPIDNPDYPPARVTIQPLCNSSAGHLLYCDFGIKFYYGINCLNKQ